MDVITASDLKLLASRSQGPWVSLFQPTHRGGPDIRQDPIRFKNLARQAEEQLRALGWRAGEIEDFLAPAWRVFEDAAFWRFQSDGLATFIASDLLQCFRVPVAFDELVVVADRPHLKPLLTLLTGDGLFYLLALSQNEVRLFACTRERVDEIDLTGVPRSLAEALPFDDPERQLQYHTGTPGGGAGGGRAAIFHGHGTGIDDSKVNVLRFFRLVDRGLSRYLKHSSAPLVLAGVEFLLPLYREANSYPVVAPEGVLGNPDGVSPEMLHARAWPLVEPHFARTREAAAARYRELAGTGRTAADIRHVLPAVFQGRVDTLFVAVGDQIWGTFDPGSSALSLHDRPAPGDEDLLNLAALETALNGGTVYAVPAAQVPEAPLSAVFRY